MAVASWMLKGRNTPWAAASYGRGRGENDKDHVKLDLERDPYINAREILIEITKEDKLTDGRHLNYLNVLVKLILHVNEDLYKLGYSTVEILCCLRLNLAHESTQIRSGAMRAIRHLLQTENDVLQLNNLLIPSFIARSLDIVLKNDVERIEAMKLMRKVLLLSPGNFDIAMARSLVALANGGIEEKDRMLRACLAILCELGVLNSEVFIMSGGVGAVTRNLSECQSPKISEALCGVLLMLLDRPITRNHAAVDLHCVAAPYCDFHYRHDWSDKNRDERELSFKCSRLTLLSILRSWPGILHFCSPQDTSGLKALVDVLYLDQLEVRKAILDLLYDLLGLSQPEWTDELSVALSAIDPAEPQASWRLNEGFVAAEGRAILPHLSRTTPNLTEMHLSLLLYCFLETGLLGALGEVISTSDTFISVRATVLLGELLRLIQILIPPECSNITPALPNLLEYATYNKPQALRAITALQQLHKLLKRRPASYSLYLDFVLQSGSFMKSSAKSERLKKCKLNRSRSKIAQFVMKDGDEKIKETGVLSNKDAYTWNWNLIKLILRRETEFNLDMNETNHRTFMKRLLEFYMPSNNRYSHMDLTTPKNTQGYTMVGIELIDFLSNIEDAFCEKLLVDLFTDISNHISAITSGKSAHDCLFSPQHMANTQCQSYFLYIGRFATTKLGTDVLNYLNVFKQLEQLAITTNHDCYVKLIISSLDYRENNQMRKLLAEVLVCPQESSRLYATQFLLVLLRAGLAKFNSWGVNLLIKQLRDKCRTIRLTALSTLHEACEVPSALETLIKTNPELLHLGEKGLLLLIRFLSTKSGFVALNKNDFIINEIRRWDDHFNYRYVSIVETETADVLTLHQRGEDGRYDKRTSSLRSSKDRKDLFLPPHIYGQLPKHPEGYRLLMEYGSIEHMILTVQSGFCETNEDIAKMKAALWALGHFGTSVEGLETLLRKNILSFMVQIAETCVVYSVRATSFYAIGLLATTKVGADTLFKLGWVCTRHDRHDRWPLIEEENWSEKLEESSVDFSLSAEDSDRTSSDQAFVGEFYIPDADSSTTDDDLLFLTGNPLISGGNISGGNLSGGNNLILHQKSSTLPVNQHNSSAYHKRSLSESKTFEIVRVHDVKGREKDLKFLELPHRHRDNSVTESTTSGVSSCDSVMGRCIPNEKTQTLSPIPSSSSLITIKTGGVKIRRHSESSRRISVQSTPSDKPSSVSSSFGKLSQQDLIGYATIRSLRKNFSQSEEETELPTNRPKFFHSFERPRKFPSCSSTQETFENHLRDGLSLSSLSSVQRFSIKDQADLKGQCYLGIALPLFILNVFPGVPVTSRRLSYSDKNILLEENLSDAESDSCLLETSNSNTSTRRKKRFKHDVHSCFKCSSLLGQLPLTSTVWRDSKKEPINPGSVNITPTASLVNSLDVIRCEVLKQVENLANPILIRHSKQALLQYKQRNPEVFRDPCLYSEVFKMLSECCFRLAPRRLLQELFLEVSYDSLYTHPKTILSMERDPPTSEEPQTSRESFTSREPPQNYNTNPNNTNINNENTNNSNTSNLNTNNSKTSNPYTINSNTSNANTNNPIRSNHTYLNTPKTGNSKMGNSKIASNETGNNKTSRSTYSQLAYEQRRAELQTPTKGDNQGQGKSRSHFINVTKGFNIDIKNPKREYSMEKGEDSSSSGRYSPTKYEPRSPPLSSVKEETLLSTDDLLSEFGRDKEGGCKEDLNKGDLKNEQLIKEFNKGDYNKVDSNKGDIVKTEDGTSVQGSIIKPIESLNLICNENKFPIKHRDSSQQNVIK